MIGGLPAWFVVPCCSSSLASSLLPSSSISVLRGAEKFPVGSSVCGHIHGSHTLPLITAVLFGRLACFSEGFRFRLFCLWNSLGDSTSSGWSVSFISQWMTAYRCSMPVNSALPSRCLHSMALFVSALVVRSLHTYFFLAVGV
jgi:hypothetical protein